MILQALVNHYETLAEQGKVCRSGWCQAKISYGLNLAKDGNLRGIVLLKTEELRGKKTVQVPQLLTVPQMVARSSGISANFLCDNSKYLLGIDKDGSGKRVVDCFLAAKELHRQILKDVHNEMAEAVKAFFESWNPEKASEHPDIAAMWDDLTAGGNLIFCMGWNYAQDDEEMKKAWEAACDCSEEGKKGVCLVTGKEAEIARIHGTIKGVQGAQSSGAALVSFNAPSFESYGKEQSYNAPVGKYAAFAYTTALNYLLNQRDYVFTFGDTTIVFWSEDGEERYQDAFLDFFDPKEDNQEIIKGVFQNLKEDKAIAVDELELNMNQRFYILGLSPNAARLSVRFFYQDSFGNILRNLKTHYEQLRIVRPSWEPEYLGIRRVLDETVNQKSREKKPLPNMASGLFRAILSGGNYPESLYSNTLIRIRVDQGREKITYGRAAIMKAYLLRNKKRLEKGEDYVRVNEKSKEVPYILGRIFAVLEEIQEKANPGINATIRDRYFNAACATPASVFAILLKLKNSHIRKMESEGLKVYYEKMLTELLAEVEECPKRLTLDEQGEFILGYYHQVQKRFTKKEEK